MIATSHAHTLVHLARAAALQAVARTVADAPAEVAKADAEAPGAVRHGPEDPLDAQQDCVANLLDPIPYAEPTIRAAMAAAGSVVQAMADRSAKLCGHHAEPVRAACQATAAR